VPLGHSEPVAPVEQYGTTANNSKGKGSSSSSNCSPLVLVEGQQRTQAQGVDIREQFLFFYVFLRLTSLLTSAAIMAMSHCDCFLPCCAKQSPSVGQARSPLAGWEIAGPVPWAHTAALLLTTSPATHALKGSPQQQLAAGLLQNAEVC
jgi:hypothetical protein